MMDTRQNTLYRIRWRSQHNLLTKSYIYTEANAANTADFELHGAEYQIWGDRYLRGHHDRNVPCAVCEVCTRSKHLMIPALYDCPTGWTEECDGWLVAERKLNNHKGRITYSCIDKNPDVLPGLYGNEDGVLLHPVEAVCNGIPCPPYDDHRSLLCGVYQVNHINSKNHTCIIYLEIDNIKRK